MIPAINSPVFRAFDVNGKPLVGGKLYSYAAGTLSPQATFTDSTHNVPNTNPTILDSTGQATVFMGGAPYKFILKDQYGVQQWSADNITQAGGGGEDFIGGVWSGTLSYLVGAVVQYGSGFYLGIQGSTGVTPGTDPTTWVLMNGAPPTPPVALTIDSFTGGSAQEVGFAVVNPVFNATYTGTPTSANITNTDSINSPLALTSPYLTGTVTGSFSHSSPATTTFTLAASDGTRNPTATQTITWDKRIFGGLGAAGASATVTASGTTAVLSTSDALPTIQLGAETTGQMLGTYTPSGQSIYLLLIGGSHSFIDTGTGFPMAFNSPTAVTFVNANGVSLGMNLYESTNPLTGSFAVKVSA